MASTVRNKVGKYTYLYESESYRDSNGKPQTKKTRIGKIDHKTGETVYDAEYLERVRGTEKEPDFSTVKQYSAKDIYGSAILDYGAYYFFDSIATEIGLIDVLKKSVPYCWEKITTLAFYMISTGEPAMYCEDWLERSESLPCGNMSSQKISGLLSAISNEERLLFYEKRCELRSEIEYMALDTASISSCSEFIGDVERGYNRDKEKLPRVNICMMLGETSQLPVFQMVYSGSLNDVSTLITTLEHAAGVKIKNISITMDKGFSKKDTIDKLLDSDSGIRFLLAIPMTLSFTKDRVRSEYDTIDAAENTILIGDDIIRGITRNCSWHNSEHGVYAHSFFNPEETYGKRNELYGKVTKLRAEAAMNPKNPDYVKDFAKYLSIRKNKNQPSGYSIKIRNDTIASELEHKGRLILISNHIDSAEKAIEIYRKKDLVEKGFMRMKNCLDLGRLRVHSDERMQNKLFVGFIALILMPHIDKVMSEQKLYERMTMTKMIKTLERLRVQYINEGRILFPLTADHKSILDAFKLPYPA